MISQNTRQTGQRYRQFTQKTFREENIVLPAKKGGDRGKKSAVPSLFYGSKRKNDLLLLYHRAKVLFQISGGDFPFLEVWFPQDLLQKFFVGLHALDL